VFASVRFRKHDVITVHENAGVNLQDKCARERYRGYILNMPEVGEIAGKQFCDLSPHMGVGSLVNSCRAVGQANVVYHVYDGVVYVVASCDIAPGEQLLVSMGLASS
jgi:hypothetical protein